jgi:hypothetical protein
MDGMKHIGMDVHKETISFAALSSAGKFMMEAVIETKPLMIQLSWTCPSQSKSEDLGLRRATLAYRESLSSVFSLAPAIS